MSLITKLFETDSCAFSLPTGIRNKNMLSMQYIRISNYQYGNNVDSTLELANCFTSSVYSGQIFHLLSYVKLAHGELIA